MQNYQGGSKTKNFNVTKVLKICYITTSPISKLVDLYILYSSNSNNKSFIRPNTRKLFTAMAMNTDFFLKLPDTRKQYLKYYVHNNTNKNFEYYKWGEGDTMIMFNNFLTKK